MFTFNAGYMFLLHVESVYVCVWKRYDGVIRDSMIMALSCPGQRQLPRPHRGKWMRFIVMTIRYRNILLSTSFFQLQTRNVNHTAGFVGSATRPSALRALGRPINPAPNAIGRRLPSGQRVGNVVSDVAPSRIRSGSILCARCCSRCISCAATAGPNSCVSLSFALTVRRRGARMFAA